ncbi:aminoacyl-histidine dipeptidase [Geomesophilobacter sediminis]|uniref:Cytosol non-specific dipeptidase n=1 Tax=Geomesophilobacter sediminis TaxID=2798584 RepID=A0A8J7M261_9BACT|nr:aminoacyl-histidine dipeptidase [Geomesophilobacter sediminis]MBJ6727111.1 aminoacyl-histidine dipeptidase [Geomesophilobacter sediminis]
MSEAINGLKPEILWEKFAEVTGIPRPSKHEEKIAAHVVATAQRLSLEVFRDAGGNVVVRKPASPGREQVAPICLQSHLDMVAEKNAEKVHDFLNDPIQLLRNGPYLTANGTTLGADNGIGVATSLAIMASNDLEHGPLEFLFTLDEETGLTGAQNLDGSKIQSRILLNLDSEDEGVIFVGCAGGRDSLGRWEARRDAAGSGGVALLLSVKGLRGGHSGLDIDKGLGNAIKIANRAVRMLAGIGGRLARIDGGNMRNAIPRECEAVVVIPADAVAQAKEMVSRLEKAVRNELTPVDAGVTVTCAEADAPSDLAVLEPELQEKLCRAISAMPHGVLQMSRDIAGLVETSTNTAVIKTEASSITLITSQRSSIGSRLDEAVESVVSIFELGGAQVETSHGYPGWKPDLDSPILQQAKACYQSLFGKEPKVEAIHAGLECGIIGERVPGMDMISFGPTLEAVHSPDERIEIESVGKFWEFLKEILRTAK